MTDPTDQDQAVFLHWQQHEDGITKPWHHLTVKWYKSSPYWLVLFFKHCIYNEKCIDSNNRNKHNSTWYNGFLSLFLSSITLFLKKLRRDTTDTHTYTIHHKATTIKRSNYPTVSPRHNSALKLFKGWFFVCFVFEHTLTHTIRHKDKRVMKEGVFFSWGRIISSPQPQGGW